MGYDMKKNKTCCFFGHRKIKETDSLKNKLYESIENLIINNNVSIFLFGSKSYFNTLCLDVVTELKEKYPFIERVYVRAEYPHISEEYKTYLLESYEDTYYPESIKNAGKAVYIERNFEMIDKSDYCIIYYIEDYLPPKRKENNFLNTYYQPASGTKTAYEYAKRKNKPIIRII